jgi:hypothetical protein
LRSRVTRFRRILFIHQKQEIGLCDVALTATARSPATDEGVFMRLGSRSLPAVIYRGLLVAAFSAVLSVPTATAQIITDKTPDKVSSPTRQGMWGNIGVGFGSLGCQDCDGDRLNGLSGDGSIGWTLSPRVRLGIGSSAYTRSQNDSDYLGDAQASISVATVDARLRFYPKTTSGFFITGGLGVGMLRTKASVSYNGTPLLAYKNTDTGAGAVMGIGWDIDLSKHVSLTPSYMGFAMASSHADANVGQLGIGVTIR